MMKISFLAEVGLSEIKFHTFGCKVNTYDTGLLQKNLEGFDTDRKIHVLNTCAVTRQATLDAVRLSRKLKREDPEAFVLVTGCSAQIDKDEFRVPEVDLLIGNSHKEELREILNHTLTRKDHEKFYHKNIFKKSSLGVGGGEEQSHSRSFLKVQDGCNSFCSFCVIPFTRGLSRSLETSEIVGKVKDLVLKGVKEVVLTGIHLGDYEDQQNRRLEDLVEEILEKTNIPRLRLSSLEPPEISSRLLNLYKDPRLCPHFHISVQSVNTPILKAMKRKYSGEEVLDSFQRVKEAIPEVFIGMDLIVGFPGETDHEFEVTYNALKGSSFWDRIHVFPYSERPKTKAASLKEEVVPLMDRKARAKKMRALSQDRFRESLKAQVGKKLSVVTLDASIKNSGWRRALASNYWTLALEPSVAPHKVIEVEVEDVDFSNHSEGILLGRILT